MRELVAFRRNLYEGMHEIPSKSYSQVQLCVGTYSIKGGMSPSPIAIILCDIIRTICSVALTFFCIVLLYLATKH